MQLFDSHCHLDDKVFDGDRDSVLQRAKENHVEGWMTVGVDKSTSLRAVEIAAATPGCYASVGVHPHFASHCATATLLFLKSLAAQPCVHAWGETGLDFNRMLSPRPDQEKWFVRQILAADSLKLPLIFHERDSRGRLLDVLRAHTGHQRRGVVHCFSGNESELRAYLDLGLCIGVTGILTLKIRGAQLRKLMRYVPADRLLIETDAPYLTPAPEKNKTRRNEPAFVKSVLLKLAAVRKEDPEILARRTLKNTQWLFDIP